MENRSWVYWLGVLVGLLLLTIPEAVLLSAPFVVYHLTGNRWYMVAWFMAYTARVLYRIIRRSEK